MSDSPSKPSCRGLVNCGNQCYRNCVIQCLALTKELQQYFAEPADGESHHWWLRDTLLHLICFPNEQAFHPDVSGGARWDNHPPGSQDDAIWFFDSICQHVTAFANVFQYEDVSNAKCTKCNKSHDICHEDHVLRLSMPGLSDTVTLEAKTKLLRWPPDVFVGNIQQHFTTNKKDNLDCNSKKGCKKKNKKVIKQEHEIEPPTWSSAPLCLAITMNDSAKEASFVPPAERFTVKVSTEDVLYELYAMIIYLPDVPHYITVGRMSNDDDETSQWIIFDDAIVNAGLSNHDIFAQLESRDSNWWKNITLTFYRKGTRQQDSTAQKSKGKKQEEPNVVEIFRQLMTHVDDEDSTWEDAVQESQLSGNKANQVIALNLLGRGKSKKHKNNVLKQYRQKRQSAAEEENKKNNPNPPHAACAYFETVLVPKMSLL